MRSRSCRMAPQRRRNRRRSSSICCRWLGVSWIAFRTSRYSSVACSEGMLVKRRTIAAVSQPSVCVRDTRCSLLELLPVGNMFDTDQKSRFSEGAEQHNAAGQLHQGGVPVRCWSLRKQPGGTGISWRGARWTRCSAVRLQHMHSSPVSSIHAPEASAHGASNVATIVAGTFLSSTPDSKHNRSNRSAMGEPRTHSPLQAMMAA